MRAVYLALALMGAAAVEALSMETSIPGGDVLARCQALLSSSSSTSTASASAYSSIAESNLPSDVTAVLAASSLQWTQLPDIARVGLLWAHGYVAAGSSLAKVYTSCGTGTDGVSASASATASEEARGVSMDQIALSSSAFASTQCLFNTCGVYHQSTNTNCGDVLPSQLLCAVEPISGGTSVPTATGSFWSDAGDGSSETPFPQLFSHSVPVARNVTSSGVPASVTLTSIHMTTKGALAPPSCSTTGDTVIPCLQLASVSAIGSRAFCRPQIDAARVQTFLTAAKTQLQGRPSSSEATPISNSASDGSSSGSGLSTGAILGIAGGALVVLGILAFYFLRRKKTQGDGYRADRDVGGGFGRKSVGPPGSGNGGRPGNSNADYPRGANGSGGLGNDATPAKMNQFSRNDSTMPIVGDNVSGASSDYYQDSNDNGENPRPRTTSKPPYLSKNTSGSGSGSSRGAMYGKTVEEYCEESEAIREFLTDPQILMRRIPYDELTPLRLLSKGSYGEVFLAQLETRHVATKRLLPEKKTLTRSIEQFTAEIQLMCQLEHRNIVSFVGVSWDHLQNLSAVVEYMDNGDLAEVLARSKGRFTWQKEKISISMDVAEGLVYLHSMRPVVVHRDLKSKNVLLNKRGQAKLSDFGVSRKTTVNETMTSGVGTLLWTAPEIIEGRKYSEKADIFSLGVVLSEIDTCDMPYAGVTDEYGDRLPGMQIVQMVRLGELKVSLEMDCPPRLRELVMQCTSLDPDLRPTSMEVAYTLKSIIAPSLRV